jgi:hypothetical protein
VPWFRVFLLCLAAHGCAVWTPLPPDDWNTAKPTRQQVQVWIADSVVVLHAVIAQPDSLSGVPYLKHPSCDSCRIAIPMASVDSLRTGSTETGWWAFTGAMAGLVAVIVLWTLRMGGD